MCIYCGTDNAKCKKVVDRGISSKDEKDKIVDYHNKLRRKVAKGKEKKVNDILQEVASQVQQWHFMSTTATKVKSGMWLPMLI